MNKKIILALVLSIGSKLVFAVEPYEQLQTQIQRIEKDMASHRDRIEEIQSIVVGLKTELNNSVNVTKLQQRRLTEFNAKLTSQIRKIEKQISELEKKNTNTQVIISEIKIQLGELSANDKSNQQRIADLGAKLNTIEEKQSVMTGSLEQFSKQTEQKNQAIDDTIAKRTTWYGTLLAILLILVGGSYWYLRRKNNASAMTLSAQVKSAIDTVRSNEEKIAKSDTDLADSLFEILNKLKVQEMNFASAGQTVKTQPDHHLPLKLADEIHRMRKRLTSLPQDTKGVTALQKSLERLESELAEQSYEIIDHTGMSYTENLSVKARFIPSDDLGPDQKIISKVVAPQVNYDGVIIRMADIEVSIGS
jgi:hypothetical protein